MVLVLISPELSRVLNLTFKTGWSLWIAPLMFGWKPRVGLLASMKSKLPVPSQLICSISMEDKMDIGLSSNFSTHHWLDEAGVANQMDREGLSCQGLLRVVVHQPQTVYSWSSSSRDHDEYQWVETTRKQMFNSFLWDLYPIPLNRYPYSPKGLRAAHKYSKKHKARSSIKRGLN